MMDDETKAGVDMLGVGYDPKTIPAKISGFTILSDELVARYGIITAAVFGKTWRYCQMKNGVCEASQERIAQELGITRKTVNIHTERLVKDGYLIDLTPDVKGAPHKYADAGRVSISVTIGTVSATCNPKLQPPVTESYTKNMMMGASQNSRPNIFNLYEQNVGAITSLLADDLKQAEIDYPTEWIENAFKIAVANNKRNWRYISACLKNMQAHGVDYKPGKQETPAPAGPEIPYVTREDPNEANYVPAPPRPKKVRDE